MCVVGGMKGGASQKIAHACNDCIQKSANGINGESPGSDSHSPLLNNHDILLHAVLAERQVFRDRIAADVLRERGFPVHHDVATVEFGLQPPLLLPGLEREDAAKDDAEDDEEDACRGVLARGAGRPARGV